MAATPVLQALVLADHIYVDMGTGKKVIAGTFSRLSSPTFPTTYHTPTWGFICLTSVHGNLTVRLQYVDLRDNSVLLSTDAVPFHSDDPNASTELIVQIPPLPMPHAGVFAFEVLADDNVLGSLRITVSQIEGGRE